MRADPSVSQKAVLIAAAVVLGGDTLVGPALVHSLEKKGYVVIASVATADAVDRLEKTSKGNVKALVLNPREVRATSTEFSGFQSPPSPPLSPTFCARSMPLLPFASPLASPVTLIYLPVHLHLQALQPMY